MPQPTDVCGVVADFHDGSLIRVVLSLQPQMGAGLPFQFIRPIWEEEVTLCEYHLYPPEFEETPEGEAPPVYRMGVASLEGLPVRLVWSGEIVE